jgi:hypothetical protein
VGNQAIASLVPNELFSPEYSVARRLRGVLWASVPEAAVYKNSKAVFRKHKVGFAE